MAASGTTTGGRGSVRATDTLPTSRELWLALGEVDLAEAPNAEVSRQAMAGPHAHEDLLAQSPDGFHGWDNVLIA